jgi:hypothetical protein
VCFLKWVLDSFWFLVWVFEFLIFKCVFVEFWVLGTEFEMGFC